MGINGRNWKAKSQKWQEKTHEQFAIIIAKARDKWKHTIGSKYNLEREYQMTKGKLEGIKSKNTQETCRTI